MINVIKIQIPEAQTSFARRIKGKIHFIAHENDKMNIMSCNNLMEPAVTKVDNVFEATLLQLIMSPIERKKDYVLGKNMSKNFT